MTQQGLVILTAKHLSRFRKTFVSIPQDFCAPIETWLAILSRATGRDAPWLARLSVRDGDALALALWTANQDFFCRALLGEVARRYRSGKSSMSSSGPGTDADTGTSPAD